MEDMTDIEMFDVRNQMGAKMDRIKSLANQADANMSKDKCTELLSELHTACGEESCTDPNMDSFQLSVDRVCAAVNTQTKLKVETIGNFYDFQRLTVRRDNVGNNRATNTPLNERRPVRCCRDDEPIGDEELWYKSPVSISVTEVSSTLRYFEFVPFFKTFLSKRCFNSFTFLLACS